MMLSGSVIFYSFSSISGLTAIAVVVGHVILYRICIMGTHTPITVLTVQTLEADQVRMGQGLLGVVRSIGGLIGVTYKTAWFMTHRIREAMRDSHPGPLGGEGKTVEVDETYISGDKWVFINEVGWVRKRKKGIENEKVLTLVERDGRARSFHIPRVNAKTVRKIMVQQIDR